MQLARQNASSHKNGCREDAIYNRNPSDEEDHSKYVVTPFYDSPPSSLVTMASDEAASWVLNPV